MPPGHEDDDDLQAFQRLWHIWKNGKGRDGAEAEKCTLLSTAEALLQGDDGMNGLCDASLAYLQRVRSNVQASIADALGGAATGPFHLYRGIRGGDEARAFRASLAPSVGRLLSYSTTRESALGLASMGNEDHEPGLLYSCDVPTGDVVFFEGIGGDFGQGRDENEVLVLHTYRPTGVTVIVEEIRPRARIRFSLKDRPNHG